MMSERSDKDLDYGKQLETFEHLLARVDRLMGEFGKPFSASEDNDFLVVGDYWGNRQIKIEVFNLALFHPHTVQRLQSLIRKMAGWEIVYSAALHDRVPGWPNMGLYIRPHEIIDTLQRQYFPKEFQGFEYEGSRRGVERQV
jgi:hypothetical protein